MVQRAVARSNSNVSQSTAHQWNLSLVHVVKNWLKSHQAVDAPAPSVNLLNFLNAENAAPGRKQALTKTTA